jgi:undecaprenyl-diphosphatase
VQQLAGALVLAFVPAGLAGLFWSDVIEAQLFHPVPVAVALIVGGIALLVVDRGETRPGAVDSVERVAPVAGLGVGLAQALSLFPGATRTAASILGGLLVGMSRPTAVEFSFLLAIPTMFAASLYKLYKGLAGLTAGDWMLLAVGFSTAFVVALVVIRAFLQFVTTNTFRPFAVYRIILGLLVLALFGAGIVR